MTVAAQPSEYDRFGPWIDEVRTPADVPRLFRDHPLDLDAARLVLKVPRNIARRDATPDMDLYDHLLVLDAHDLTRLSRRAARAATRGRPAVPGGYDVTTVPLRHVVAIHDVVSLLDGRLTLHTRDGAALSVPYNGSAHAKVGELVSGLRAAAAGQPPSRTGRALLDAARAGAPARLDAGKDDVALVSGFREIARRHPDVVAWACHGRTPLRPSATGASGLVQRALHALSSATLQGSVLGSDDVALEVVGRHQWVLRGRAPVHSTSRLVVPLGAPDTLHLTPHTVWADATTVTLTAGASRVEIVVPTGSGAHDVLRRAARG